MAERNPKPTANRMSTVPELLWAKQPSWIPRSRAPRNSRPRDPRRRKLKLAKARRRPRTHARTDAGPESLHAGSPSASIPPSLLGGRADARRKSTSCGLFFARGARGARRVAKHARSPVISTFPASPNHPSEKKLQRRFAHGFRDNRVGPAGRPAVPAFARVRQAGQRIRRRRLPGVVRRGRARLRGILGPARKRARALAQAVHQGAR